MIFSRQETDLSSWNLAYQNTNIPIKKRYFYIKNIFIWAIDAEQLYDCCGKTHAYKLVKVLVWKL